MTHRALLTALALVLVALFAADPLADVTHAVTTQGADPLEVWGDLNCKDGLTAADGIVILAAQAQVRTGQTDACPGIGMTVSADNGPVYPFGDVNCSGQADVMDVFAIFKKVAGVTASAQGGCTNLGADVQLEMIPDAFTLDASWRDYGDAPDGQPTGYSSGAATGSFPTLPANGGPSHAVPLGAVLGETASVEDAPVTDDSADDGLLITDLHPCAASSALFLINTSGLTAQQRTQPLYLSIFADWNRDGDWLDTGGCAPEAVLNQQINVAGAKTLDVFAAEFTGGDQVGEFWMRAILTTQPYTLGAQNLRGETEDYLLVNGEEVPAALAGSQNAQPQEDKTPEKAGKEVFCRGSVVPHGANQTMTLEIEQTQASKQSGFKPGNLKKVDVGSPEKDPFSGELKGVTFPKAKLNQGTTKDGRAQFTLTLTVSSPEDAPDRIDGPIFTQVVITGTNEKTKNPYEAKVTCAFFIDHTAEAREQTPGNDGFKGGPGHGGKDPQQPGIPGPKFYVIKHNEKKVLVGSDTTNSGEGSKPDPNQTNPKGPLPVSAVFGPDGTKLEPKDYKDKAGIKEIQVAIGGRGFGITPVEDKRDDPVQRIIIRLKGKRADDSTYWDYYQLIIVHEKGTAADKLMKKFEEQNYAINPYALPEGQAFAVNYVVDGKTLISDGTDFADLGLTFGPTEICNVATGDKLSSPVAGELAYVVGYPSGSSDLFEIDLNTLPDNAICSKGTNLTGYGPSSPFGVQHPSWCWGGVYGFTEFNIPAQSDRLAFVDGTGPFPLAGGDGYSDATCFRKPVGASSVAVTGPSIGLTARKPDGTGSDVWYVPFDCNPFCPQGGSLPASPQRLVDVSGQNMHALGAVVSPDATKIAWVLAELNPAGTAFVSGQIYVADFDIGILVVGTPMQLTSSGLNLHPQWSPDSSLIVFDSNRDTNSELYSMNADGSNQRNLTNTPTINETQPSWQTP